MWLLDQVKTGVKGLDELLNGGLPKGKCILLIGSPGSGKTTLSMQYLYSGARANEPGLYVSLDEKPERVKENLAGFGWDLDKMEGEGKLFFVDGTPIRRIKPVSHVYGGPESGMIRLPELTMRGLVETVSKLVNEEGIRRIVIDPITALVIRYNELHKRRRAILMFFDFLADTGCSTIVTTELRTGVLERRFQLEEFLSHGVILLHSLVHGGSVVRAIQIEKMRGIECDTQLRPYQLSKDGLEVFPKDTVFS